jgi:hypothetical protein
MDHLRGLAAAALAAGAIQSQAATEMTPVAITPRREEQHGPHAEPPTIPQLGAAQAQQTPPAVMFQPMRQDPWPHGADAEEDETQWIVQENAQLQRDNAAAIRASSQPTAADAGTQAAADPVADGSVPPQKDRHSAVRARQSVAAAPVGKFRRQSGADLAQPKFEQPVSNAACKRGLEAS